MKLQLGLSLVLGAAAVLLAVGISCGGSGRQGSGAQDGQATLGGDQVHGEALKRKLMHRYFKR